ncbi:alpha-endosulfine isoform X4 [Macaca nemestrina]|uniref:Alpha-endosulfine n=1 Tax=Macaca mulatta TaxID=9544 RepID=A0A1D5QWW1_MACMU|nr:alpha-endosulfine isoform X5 [Macaca nemestrina]
MSQKQEEENPAEETGEEKQDTQEKEGILPERAEEAKLKAKYPSLGQKPGGSDFLMKRLQKGQKYFDSGDYNMAKAKMKNKQLPSAGPDKNLVTGDHIPTPQDLPQRKSSLVTSKLAGLTALCWLSMAFCFKGFYLENMMSGVKGIGIFHTSVLFLSVIA